VVITTGWVHQSANEVSGMIIFYCKLYALLSSRDSFMVHLSHP
jgi:hypothetical protein